MVRRKTVWKRLAVKKTILDEIEALAREENRSASNYFENFWIKTRKEKKNV